MSDNSPLQEGVLTSRKRNIGLTHTSTALSTLARSSIPITRSNCQLSGECPNLLDLGLDVEDGVVRACERPRPSNGIGGDE